MLYDKQGKIVKVYPYGSEEQQRYEKVLEILFEADRRYLEKLLEKRSRKQQEIDSQIESNGKKIFKRDIKPSVKL